MSNTIELGNEVIVSDPCYTRGTWCSGTINGVKPGTYRTSLEYMDDRVSELKVIHESKNDYRAKWEIQDFEVGVDSGQAGVFDSSIYPHGETGDSEDLNTFYGKCCQATRYNQGGSVAGKGFVSSSGWGDGGYQCYVAKDKNGSIYGIRIIYIYDEEEG